MATYYLDYTQGSDLGSGAAFAGTPILTNIANATLTNGSLTATAASTPTNVRATGGIAGYGKSYWEVTINQFSLAASAIGLANAGFVGNAASLGGDAGANSLGYRPSGAVMRGNATLTTIGSYVTGNVICIATDMINQMIWFRVGATGQWNNSASADPATGAGGISLVGLTNLTNGYTPACSPQGSSDQCTFNFGATAYTGTPPSGFKNIVLAWQTLGKTGTTALDTIRILKSPDPTSLGQTAQWTNANVSLIGRTVSAATNASPIAITTTAAHGYSTGDYVSMNGLLGNTAANGQFQITVTGSTTFTLNGSTGNGTWTSGGTATWFSNRAVTLTTAVTANVDNCDTAWTAANSSTVLVTSTYKEGRGAAQIGTAGASTANTKYAYKALAGATDFSAYQQLSFWFKSSSTFADNQRWRICLCSDATGDTIVASANVPPMVSAQFQPVTVDFGAALPSGVQSVALYSGNTTTAAAITLTVDNIIACKASSANDSLTLTSLVSKSASATSTVEGWYPIASINGRVVMLDNGPNTVANAGKGYSGVTENVTTYKRETIRTNPSVNQGAPPASSGGNLVYYEAGFDSSGVQNGETFWDGQNANSIGMTLTSSSYTSFNRISLIRYNPGVQTFGGGMIVLTLGTVAGTTALTLSAQSIILTVTAYVNNTGSVTLPGGFASTITLPNVANTVGSGVQLNGSYRLFAGYVRNNGGAGMTGGACTIYNPVFANNTSASIASSGNNIVKNGTFSDAADFSNNNNTQNDHLFSHNHNNVVGAHKIYGEAMTIVNDTTTTHSGSGSSWKISPTSATLRNAMYPADLTIAKVFVQANLPVTFTAWFRRDNTGITGKLVVRGGQLNGIGSSTSDVTATTAAAANTWEQLTVTGTPTEAGVLEVQAWAYGGATFNCWVDDFGASQ